MIQVQAVGEGTRDQMRRGLHGVEATGGSLQGFISEATVQIDKEITAYSRPVWILGISILRKMSAWPDRYC